MTERTDRRPGRSRAGRVDLALPGVRGQGLDDGRAAAIVVWSVLVAMLLADLALLVTVGRNVPLAEDWTLVAPLGGHEPNPFRWLWSQNNEHRVPLPRLILLGALEVGGGDFRVGMLLSIATLGVTSAAALATARTLRGGRTRLVDAVFPLMLLNAGHWPNLFWSWQFTFVLSVALTIGLLLALVRPGAPATPATAVSAGVCLSLLPLCGASALLLVPAASLWVGGCGLLVLHRTAAGDRGRRLAPILIGAPTLALALTAIYFVGYEAPPWNPPNPGIAGTLTTFARFLTMGLGSVAARAPTAVVLAVAALLPIVAAGLALRALRHHRGAERRRALGIVLFGCNLGVLALAIGYGRAGSLSTDGMPLRYALLAVPLYATLFFLAELYASPRWRNIGQRGLLLVVVLALPLNTLAGWRWWGSWYDKGMSALEEDIRNGVGADDLTAGHKDFLVHWWGERALSESMRQLHRLGSGPFADMRVTTNGTRQAE